MTLNCVIALILHFFTEFDSFAGRLCHSHSGWRSTYNVCKILSSTSSLPLLAKTNAPCSAVSAIAELLVLFYQSIFTSRLPLIRLYGWISYISEPVLQYCWSFLMLSQTVKINTVYYNWLRHFLCCSHLTAALFKTCCLERINISVV